MKSLPQTVLLLALVLWAGNCFGSTADDVRCREINFSKSAENKDAVAFSTFLDPDARFVGNKVSHGIEEILAAWSSLLSAGGPDIKWRPQFVEVLEDGSLVLTRGPFRVITTDEDGRPVERWGTFNSVWRKGEDGQWRVVFDAGSPAATEPSEAQKKILETDCATPTAR